MFWTRVTFVGGCASAIDIHGVHLSKLPFRLGRAKQPGSILPGCYIVLQRIGPGDVRPNRGYLFRFFESAALYLRLHAPRFCEHLMAHAAGTQSSYYIIPDRGGVTSLFVRHVSILFGIRFLVQSSENERQKVKADLILE